METREWYEPDEETEWRLRTDPDGTKEHEKNQWELEAFLLLTDPDGRKEREEKKRQLVAFLAGEIELPAACLRPVRPVRGPVVEKIVYSTALDPFMDMAGLADYSKLSRRTLEEHTRAPVNPLPSYQINGVGKLLVRRSEFDAWLQQHKKRAEVDLSAILRDVKG